MKLKMRVLFMLVFSFVLTVFMYAVQLQINETHLQEDIKDELSSLGVHLTHRPGDQESIPPPNHPDPCSVPMDIYGVCVEDYDMRPHLTCNLAQLSQNCQLLKERHGYDKPVAEEEKEFPIAFGIKMHTSAGQAEQLLRAIYRPHNVYCIHVDRKADDSVFSTMQSVAACFDNVIITDRINFVYGSYDTIQAETLTMACALDSGVDFKYYLNLAGQEFPLRTNLELVRVLKMLNGSNDIETFPIPDRYKNRIQYQYKVEKEKMVNTTKPKDPPTFKAEIRKGSQYSSFSKPFVQAWVKQQLPQDIIDFFKDAMFPEEGLWATLNQVDGVPGGYPVTVEHNPGNEHLSRTVAWQWYDEHECRGEYVREVCIFTRADLPWLLRQPNLIVNKFRWDQDPRPAACLEAVLDQRARAAGSTILYPYFLGLPQVQYRNTHARSSLPSTAQ